MKLVIKKNLYVICCTLIIILSLPSCQKTLYSGTYGNTNQTIVNLQSANFKTLGTFTATASARKLTITIKNTEGVISQAKTAMLAKAKEAGAELSGSRALVNMSVDIIESETRVTATVSGTIIEFTK